jgi:hypothetical protein
MGVDPAHFHWMIQALTPHWQRQENGKNRSGHPYGVNKACICRSLARIEKIAHRVLGIKNASSSPKRKRRH